MVDLNSFVNTSLTVAALTQWILGNVNISNLFPCMVISSLCSGLGMAPVGAIA